MRIKQLAIKNFRCLKDVSLPIDKITILLGRNSAGKSTALQAIKVFYDVAYRATNEDFSNNDITDPIEISVTYCDLSPAELVEFKSYLNDDELSVLKRISSDGSGKYYASSSHVPEFQSFFNAQSKSDKVSAYKSLQADPKFSALPNERSSDKCESNLADFEMNNPALCENIPRETQFFGPASVGGGKLDKFTKYVLVPAVKEVADELTAKSKTYLQQLLDYVVLRKINAREDIKAFKQEYDQKVRTLYSSDNLHELPAVGSEVSQILNKYSPGTEFHLAWGEVKPPEINLPPAAASLTEDGYRGDISRKGHGLQRSLIFALLEYLSKLSPVISDESKTGDDPPTTKLILAIEEPELYQHPLKCRFLAKLLTTLVKSDETQLIYTTHSPYFVDLSFYNNIRIVKKSSTDDSIKLGNIHYCKIEELAARSEQLVGAAEGSFSTESFIARASPVMDSIVNEGFFADTVVVVEGFGDFGCLWMLQEILGKDWAAKGIAIVPARGKNNIDRPVLIFRSFGIVTYFIFDGDIENKTKGSKEEETKRTNKRLLRLAGASPEDDFPATQIHSTWACFENNLESILLQDLGEKNFASVSDQVTQELGYTSRKQMLKNIDGMASVVKVAYEAGMHLPTLEAIVEAITSLATPPSGGTPDCPA